MLPTTLNIADFFEKTGYEAWKSLAEADLKGAPFDQKLITHTYEGVLVQPLYTRQNTPQVGPSCPASGLAPFTRFASLLGHTRQGWDIRVEHADADLTVANKAILADLEGGATSLVLRLDAAGRLGLDPTNHDGLHLAGRDGICLSTVDDLDALLSGVHLDMVHVSLEAGAAFIPAASLLAGLWSRRGHAPHSIRGCFQADPLAVLARDGHLPYALQDGLAMAAELATWTAHAFPDTNVRALRVGTAPYHHAGATATQDLALAMATALEYLRAMLATGLSIDQASRQILFSFAVGSNMFLAAAKLRAARLLWHRLVTASGGSDASAAMQMYVRPSRRIMATRDVWMNVLRSTSCVMAAAVGGADAISAMPHDATIGAPSEHARRLARNTHHILMEECSLHQVCDPLGGSWYIESLTHDLADRAWIIFQTIERMGGMAQALCSGWIANQLDQSRQPRVRDMATRRHVLVGASDYIDPTEDPQVPTFPDYRKIALAAQQRLAHRAIKPLEFSAHSARPEQALHLAQAGATIGQITQAIATNTTPEDLPSPISVHALAEPFEHLRDIADKHHATCGHKPKMVLICLDSPDNLRPRLAFCEHLLQAGGFEITILQFEDNIQAIQQSFHNQHARLAMLVGADAQYPQLIPLLAPALHHAGAKLITLAGNPGPHEHTYRAAGVDRFAFLKVDAPALLAKLLAVECGLEMSSAPTSLTHQDSISSPTADLHTGYLS
jgi:methylmalonyl-CoA mutase